jgi:hypothetical protein
LARAGARQSWDEFASSNADLLTWENGILHQYYRRETLATDLARAIFIFPDKVTGR